MAAWRSALGGDRNQRCHYLRSSISKNADRIAADFLPQVSDALYLRAMLMTSPLAVTLGMSLTIPFAMAGDVYRGTEFGGWKVYIGGTSICAHLINYDD